MFEMNKSIMFFFFNDSLYLKTMSRNIIMSLQCWYY